MDTNIDDTSIDDTNIDDTNIDDSGSNWNLSNDNDIYQINDTNRDDTDIDKNIGYMLYYTRLSTVLLCLYCFVILLIPYTLW